MNEDNLTPEQYEKLKTLTPEQFRQMEKEQKKEIIQKHNGQLNPYGLVTKDIGEMRTAWAIAVIFAVLTAGILYFSYEGMFRTNVAFAPNFTAVCQGYSFNCTPVSICNVSCGDCKFPSEININIKNYTG